MRLWKLLQTKIDASLSNIPFGLTDLPAILNTGEN